MATPTYALRQWYKYVIKLNVGRRHYTTSVEYHPKLKPRAVRVAQEESERKELERRKRVVMPSLESINIPERIERGPTDILKALASTVGRDYTAPHYRFHDDPYLIPQSNAAKRNFALSKESGKKAAKWIKQQHAELFQHREAEPPVEAFFPIPIFTEESEVNESDLTKLVNQGLLREAITVYNLMKNKGTEISKEAKQSFLELLCYCNEEELLDEDFIEERWYKSGVMSRERMKNSWKERGIAEELFQEIEDPDITTYCAMIRGRAKFYQVDKAWTLYQEVLGKGLTIDVETYNSLLKICNFLREASDLRWKLVQELLTDMKERGVEPNLGTMNSILETLSTIGNIKQAKALCLQTLSEFKMIGIEPSLASFYFLLITFCKDRGPASTILADILKELHGKDLKIRDPKDTFFFVTAMDVARNHLQNLELAERVNELLHTGDNYDLIGDSFKESIYYRHLVALKCNMEQFDTFMEFYDKIVPNIYTPEPGIMEEILRSLELNCATQYLPRLWSDMIIFDHVLRENLLALVLNICATQYPSVNEDEISDASKLAKEFAKISWRIWTIIETQDRERSRVVNWSGQMLGDLITVQIRSGGYEKACGVIKKLVQGTQDVVGVPSLDSLRLFLEAAVESNSGSMSLACLHYINECGFPEIVDLAEDVHSKVKLDSIQVAKLSSMIGYDISSKSRISADE